MTNRNKDEEWIRPFFPPSNDPLSKITATPFPTDTMNLDLNGAVGEWGSFGIPLLNFLLSVMHELYRVKPTHLIDSGFLKKKKEHVAVCPFVINLTDPNNKLGDILQDDSWHHSNKCILIFSTGEGEKKLGIPGEQFLILEFALSETLGKDTTLSTTLDPIPAGFMTWFEGKLVDIIPRFGTSLSPQKSKMTLYKSNDKRTTRHIITNIIPDACKSIPAMAVSVITSVCRGEHKDVKKVVEETTAEGMTAFLSNVIVEMSQCYRNVPCPLSRYYQFLKEDASTGLLIMREIMSEPLVPTEVILLHHDRDKKLSYSVKEFGATLASTETPCIAFKGDYTLFYQVLEDGEQVPTVHSPRVQAPPPQRDEKKKERKAVDLKSMAAMFKRDAGKRAKESIIVVPNPMGKDDSTSDITGSIASRISSPKATVSAIEKSGESHTMFYGSSYNEGGQDSHMLLGQPSSTQNGSQTQDADEGSQTHSNDVQNGNDTYMFVESPNDKDTSTNASSASSKDTSSAQELPKAVSYDDDAQNGNDTKMLVQSTDSKMPVESTTDNAVKASSNANASSASYDAYIWDISNESNNARFQVYTGGRGKSKSNVKHLVQKSVKAPYQLQVMTTTSSTRASETRIQQIVTLKSNNMSGDSKEIRVKVYSISNDCLVKDAAWGTYNTFQFGDQYIMAPSFLCASLVQLLYTMFTPPELDKVQCHCGCKRTITKNDEQWLRIEDRMNDIVCFEKIPHFSQWLSYRGHYAYIIDWGGYRILANTFVRYGIQDKLAFSTLVPPMPFRPINNLSAFFKDSKELHNDNRRCDTNHTLVWYAGFVRKSVALRPKNDGHMHLPENLVLPFLGEGWKDADFIANNLASVWKIARGEGLPKDEDQWKNAVVFSREGNVPIGERCNKDYHGKNAYLPITFDGAVTPLKNLTTDIDWD